MATTDAEYAEDQKKFRPEDFHFEGLTLADVTPKLERSWIFYPHLRKLNLLLLSGIMWNTASGFDGSIFNGMQSLPQWYNYFDTPTGIRLSVSTIPSAVANVIANFFMYLVLEKWGRRKPIILGSFLIIVSAILKGFSQNYAMWIWTPLIQGFGVAFVSVTAPAYISETAYPPHRGKAVALYASTWQMGALIAAGMNYGMLQVQSTWAWRATVMVQGVPSLIEMILAWFAPESPRWLVAQGRTKEAFEILVKYHAGGDYNSPLPHFTLAEIAASLEEEKLQNASKWSEWTRTRGNIHRLAICVVVPMSLQWAGNALTSYYLHLVLNTVGITDSKQQLGINIGLSGWSLVCGIAVAMVIDYYGRRKLMIWGYLSMLVVYIIWTVCSAINEQQDFKNEGLAAAVVLMIFLYSPAYNLVASVASAYQMEIAPYSLRSKAASLYQLCGSLPGLFNSFANPPILDIIGWKYYIVWCCMNAIWLTFAYFYVLETKGRGLEEVAEIFDGKDAIAGNTAMAKFGMVGMFNKDDGVVTGLRTEFQDKAEQAHIEGQRDELNVRV